MAKTLSPDDRLIAHWLKHGDSRCDDCVGGMRLHYNRKRVKARKEALARIHQASQEKKA